MKRILLALCTIVPLSAFADIIATYNNGNIEDVTVVSVGADEVVYKQGKAQKSIASSEVEGVLYDDGRFVSPPKKAAVADSLESPSDDSWAIEDASTDNSSSEPSNRRQKREKKERSRSNSEVGQAFKEAGVAIKDAFTTMFDAMGKKKDKKHSENAGAETETNQNTSASEDGW